MTTPILPIMQRLKQDTEALHDLAESHPFQVALVKGRLSIGAYAAYLGALHAVHEPLERLLRAVADRTPFSRVVGESQYQTANLLADFAFLESADKGGNTADSRLVARVGVWAKNDPVALLGALYVLEGSKNGGRFIARAVRRAYDLPPRDGTRYLDPHGDEQPALWAQFKGAMNAIDWTPHEEGLIVDAACTTFAGLISALDGLSARFRYECVPFRIATILPTREPFDRSREVLACV